VIPSTIEVIKQRTLENSLPKNRTDGYKVGLCIEGGAMRGSVSAGAGAALELLGMRNGIDVVLGASAGAFNAAFFLANQALYGSQIYLDHANNRHFINVSRHLIKKKILNLEYLFDEVLSKRMPLDWASVVNSDIPFRVIATDAIRAKSTTVPVGKTQASLFTALHATAHIPGAHGNKPINVDGKLLWDAALLDPFCFDISVSEKCTHLLFLLSLPLERDREAGLSDKYFLAPYIRKFSPKLAEEYISKYSHDLDRLFTLIYRDKIPQVRAIAPPADARIPGPLTKDRSLLAQGVMVGLETVLEQFEIDMELGERIRAHVIKYLNIEIAQKQTRSRFNPATERLAG